MADRIVKICICMLMMSFLCGCLRESSKEEKVRDIDFTVVSQDEISDELQKYIDERKEKAFTLIYKDGENMYLVVGYGQQAGSGYSIQVNDLYLGVTSVNVSTSLLGSSETTESGENVSCPYIVLKTESLDNPVLFDM